MMVMGRLVYISYLFMMLSVVYVIMQRLRSIRGKTPETSLPEPMEETDSSTSSFSERRREAAEAQRRNLMQQISSMQNRFYQDHKQELDLIETSAREKQSVKYVVCMGYVLTLASLIKVVEELQHRDTSCVYE